MKYLFLSLLLVIGTDVNPNKIAKLNNQKEKARIAYESGNFQEAVKQYTYLIDSMGYSDDYAKLNLSNAYYQLKDTLHSLDNYNRLTESKDKKITSIANQQLGVMANNLNKPEEAMEFFKKALRADPTNEDARYNYELLKKQQQEQEQQKDQQNQDQQQDQQNQDQQQQDQKNQDQQQQDQQNQDQQQQDQKNQDQQQQDQKNQDQQQQDQKNQDQQQQDQQNQDQQQQDQKNQDQQNQDQQPKEGEEQQNQQEPQEMTEEEKEKQKQQDLKSIQEKLKQMNISPEKAKMILEAMKNNEVQYLQQNQRKGSKKKDKSKPDW